MAVHLINMFSFLGFNGCYEENVRKSIPKGENNIFLRKELIWNQP